MYDEIAEKLSGVCKILDQLEDPNLHVVIKEQGIARTSRMFIS